MILINSFRSGDVLIRFFILKLSSLNNNNNNNNSNEGESKPFELYELPGKNNCSSYLRADHFSCCCLRIGNFDSSSEFSH
jgi:hypothetical protein